MRKTIPFVIVAALFVSAAVTGAFRLRRAPDVPDVPTTANPKQVTLPSGWCVTPAGRAVPLPGDLPLKMLVSGDGKTLIVSTGGFHDHGVSLVDIAAGTVQQSVNLVKNWAGMCLDPAGNDLYIAG